MGSPNDEFVTAITVGADGGVVLTGSFTGTLDFDPGAGVDSHTATTSATEPYVVKLTADGAFVWARTFAIESPESGIGTTSVA